MYPSYDPVVLSMGVELVVVEMLVVVVVLFVGITGAVVVVVIGGWGYTVGFGVAMSLPSVVVVYTD